MNKFKLNVLMLIVFSVSSLVEAGQVRIVKYQNDYGSTNLDISFCNHLMGDRHLATYIKAIKELEEEGKLSQYGIEDHLFFKANPKKEVLTHFSKCLERSSAKSQTLAEAKAKLLENDAKLLKNFASLQREVVNNDDPVIRPHVENRNFKMIVAIDKANSEKTFRTVLEPPTKDREFARLCINTINYLGQYSRKERKCSNELTDSNEVREAREINALSYYTSLNYREIPDVSPSELIPEIKRTRLAHLCSANHIQESRRRAEEDANPLIIGILNNISVCPEQNSGGKSSQAVN